MAILRAAGVIARLTAETQDRCHQIDLALGALPYRAYLRRMYGLYEPVEKALGATRALDDVVTDARLRNNKVALLVFDLVSNGIDRSALSTLPRLPVPPLGDLTRALGWMYVLEATTLAARRLRRDEDGTYLACYGRGADRRWREFAHALEAYATSTGTTEAIAASANDALERIARWLSPPAVIEQPDA
jgi:heme oxygenase